MATRRAAVTRAPRIRVLYSFPGKIGATRIDYTAWEQVRWLPKAGAHVELLAGVVHRPLPESVTVSTTLARGRWRLPYRVLGRLRSFELHDRIVARRLSVAQDRYDVVHVWPLAAYHTLRAAARIGIPTLLERPNAHTRYAYDVVKREAERIGVRLPPSHEHAYNDAILEREEEEYRLADALLCPSDFVIRTFLDEGFPRDRLLRHIYGFDPVRFSAAQRDEADGLVVLFAGVAAVRKGTHLALEAWLASPASLRGTFLIAGDFLPDYERLLRPMLDHPSVRVLGHRDDLPDLMRTADALLLPSLEEGSALVVGEAMASGCVPLVSDSSSGIVVHEGNALVHAAGDVAALTGHITQIDRDRDLLRRLRAGAVSSARDVTWEAAARRLVDCYAHMLSHAQRVEA